MDMALCMWNVSYIKRSVLYVVFINVSLPHRKGLCPTHEDVRLPHKHWETNINEETNRFLMWPWEVPPASPMDYDRVAHSALKFLLNGQAQLS